MKIALVGLGRTGKIVAEYLLQKDVLSIVLCKQNSFSANKDLGDILGRKNTGIIVESSDHLERRLFGKNPDVLIDFSSKSFLRDNINLLAQYGVNVVTAVTDYEPAEIEKIKSIAEQGNIGVVMAPNITYGVNILMLMVEIAAELMNDYDFEIIEEHHKHKRDQPSGTARKIADKISNTLLVYREIAAHSVRAGDIIGKHKILICNEIEKIEISHESFSRVAFAQGAYKAAQFICGKRGFYEMRDIFEEERNQRQQKVSAYNLETIELDLA
ncbi:MAG: Dihydrodipicolinate reductase [Firmicutes bacterium]|nr:Dihydrodipicolinate reductase [Bacillota bacterium]